jgi:hypothetical protein
MRCVPSCRLEERVTGIEKIGFGGEGGPIDEPFGLSEEAETAPESAVSRWSRR